MSIPLSQLIAESGWTSTPTVDVQAGSVDHFGHARAVRAASAASRVSGLVTDTTSGPHLRQEGDDVVVDTYVNRFKRMRYNVVASSNWLNVDATRGGFRIWPVFITLTYRTIDQPEPRHISDFLKLVRRHCQRRDIQCRYVWVAELQERGVLHYHVIVWMPHGYKLPKPDKQGWWPHGWSNIKKADSPVGYLAHYAGKLKSKCTNAGFAIPRGFRLYGVGGLDTDDKRKRAWANLPGWLRSLVEPWHRTKRILGGGFVSRETLEHWPSPWRIGRIVRAGSGALVHLIRHYQRVPSYVLQHIDSENRRPSDQAGRQEVRQLPRRTAGDDPAPRPVHPGAGLRPSRRRPEAVRNRHVRTRRRQHHPW